MKKILSMAAVATPAMAAAPTLGELWGYLALIAMFSFFGLFLYFLILTKKEGKKMESISNEEIDKWEGEFKEPEVDQNAVKSAKKVMKKKEEKGVYNVGNLISDGDGGEHNGPVEKREDKEYLEFLEKEEAEDEPRKVDEFVHHEINYKVTDGKSAGSYLNTLFFAAIIVIAAMLYFYNK